MPGANDPTQCLIPQQPIPRYVFTGADEKKYSNFQTVTNPYRFSLGGLQFVGTSGFLTRNNLTSSKNLKKVSIHKTG